MDVSIVIVNFNTKVLLDRCLRSIIDSLRTSKFTYEIIVVDNGSTDGSRELLNKKYPRVIKIFNNTNIGFGKANNIGIHKAKSESILLLNSDIKVTENAIEKLYMFAKQHTRAFVGGKLFNEDMTPQPSCGPQFSLINVFIMLFLKGDTIGITRSSPDSVLSVSWVSGACVIATKAAFIDIGLFDESIFMYMEEIDLLYRARQKGYTIIFYPEAKFIHTGAASSGSSRKPVINIYRGLRYFYRKHRSIIEIWMLEILLRTKAYIAIGIGALTRNHDLVSTYEQALRLDY
ncbi:hypothetical protein A2Z00_02295 [Candidatus Gottesmanbacteria bacterium RBG_13_45_10]|uniref:Glycosyltransferase 2-like domain-containing protein n=1 Tax=Candidatus Gottesmanbacteria bacterium RBG_13_45_10 TaxID=1798370 RepID=A0A1F5ZFS6_9BACT|nr:MAG: hypothetical protein A2Z00_02295 [Candidatus Gottesmanbacteria bacterium RBG_13_45_10]